MKDDIQLTFGKYKGRSPEDISEYDPGYIVWLVKNVDANICSKALYEYCLRETRRSNDFDSELEHATDKHFEQDGW